MFNMSYKLRRINIIVTVFLSLLYNLRKDNQLNLTHFIRSNKQFILKCN